MVPGIQAHERVREIVVLEVVLRREVVSLRLALLPDARGELVVLVQVVRNRTQVVEELAEEVPAAVPLHDVGAEEAVAFGLDRLLEQRLLAVEFDVAQPLVGGGERAVGGLGGGREPTLVDTAAMRAERVQIAGVQFEAAARHQEGAGDPARRQSDDAVAGGQGIDNEVAVRHAEYFQT